MKRSLLSIAFAASVLLHGSNPAAAQEQSLPTHYYYQGKPVSLQLNPNLYAVRVKNDFPAAKLKALAEQSGVSAIGREATGVESDVQPTGVAGWYLLPLQNPLTDVSDAASCSAQLLGISEVEFTSPVFQGQDGGWIIMTEDVLVRFKPEYLNARAAILSKLAPSLQVIEENFGNMPGAYKLRSSSRSGFEVLAGANRLAEDSRIEWSEPDAQFTGRSDLIPTDPFFSSESWGIRNLGQYGGTVNMDMDGDLAWNTTIGNPNIKVLIIDTGVQQNHPDINQLPGADFTGEGGGGGPVNACDNHGTAVAGCVSAIMNNSLGSVGIAPGCRVLSARTFISLPSCTGSWTTQSSWTVNALTWGEAQGARVSNNSNQYGSYASNAIDAKYQLTYNNGMVHFASAGNNSSSIITYPASLAVVNAVAALAPTGTLASFSNYGNGLDFAAPGAYIFTTDRTGNDGYGGGPSPFSDYALVDGTSFASPYAAGVAALILSRNSNLTPAQVEGLLQVSCRDLGATGYDTQFGWGFVNAYSAFIEMNKRPNLALKKPAGASSIKAGFLPSLAVDGITTSTFWESGALSSTTVAWWLVILDKVYTINEVRIYWGGTNYAKKYQVQTSLDGVTWTTVNTNNSGNGGTDYIPFTPRAAKLVRIYMTQNNTTSEKINEVQVYPPPLAGSLAKSDAEDDEALAAAAIPDGIMLHQNYPNPFNPSTQISYSVPSAMRVTLKIYNLAGQEVATLVNEVHQRGNYTVTFEASRLASGHYFSVLQAGEIRQVRRLVLMK